MTIVVELGPADWLCIGMGVGCLLAALLAGLGNTGWVPSRVRSPLSTALAGAAILIWPVALDIDFESHPWFSSLGLVFYMVLMLGAARVGVLQQRRSAGDQAQQPDPTARVNHHDAA